MMDLKMEVYTPALELVGLLEVHRSIIWEEKAFSSGSFSVESLITDQSRALLVPENIIWIEDNTAGIIEYVQQQAGKEGPYITVKGCDLTGLLARRILWGVYDLSGKVPDIMYRLVDDCCINPTRGDTEARKIPGLVLAEHGAFDELPSVRVQKTGGTLLEALEQLGEAYRVAFGVRFNPQVPRLEFWARPGTDRSVHQTVNDPVFYSTELDDVLSSEYTYNAQDYRNVALVAGEGEGSNRTMVVVTGGGEPEPGPGPGPEPPEPVLYTIALTVDPAGGGVATGGGSVQSGSTVTMTAAPASGYEFAGWRENGAIVSTDTVYSFTASGDRSLTAVFAVVIPTYTITATVDPDGYGTVTGAGSYQEGASVTLTATAGDGYKFTAWQENGQTVSESESYAFTVTDDRALVAVFEEVPKYEPGVDWRLVTLPLSQRWLNVAYGGGKFVAVGGDTNKAAYSSDGVVWEESTLPLSGTWVAIAYGNGKFVTLASGTNKAAYSVDGINWIIVTLPRTGNWAGLAYGNGCFVAAPGSGGWSKTVYSDDGINWNASNIPYAKDWRPITYGDGKFVMLSYDDGKVAYTENGISWSTSTLPANRWYSITYGNGKFVAVIGTETQIVGYSKNGIDWATEDITFSARCFGISFGNGRFVAARSGSDKAIYSDDGVLWHEASIPAAGSWQGIAYGDKKFVSVSGNWEKAAFSGPVV